MMTKMMTKNVNISKNDVPAKKKAVQLKPTVKSPMDQEVPRQQMQAGIDSILNANKRKRNLNICENLGLNYTGTISEKQKLHKVENNDQIKAVVINNKTEVNHIQNLNSDRIVLDSGNNNDFKLPPNGTLSIDRLTLEDVKSLDGQIQIKEGQNNKKGISQYYLNRKFNGNPSQSLMVQLGTKETKEDNIGMIWPNDDDPMKKTVNLVINKSMIEKLDMLKTYVEKYIIETGVSKHTSVEPMKPLYSNWNGTYHMKVKLIDNNNPNNSKNFRNTMVYDDREQCIIDDISSLSAADFSNQYTIKRAELAFYSVYYKKNGNVVNWGLAAPKLYNVQVNKLNNSHRGFVF